MSGDNGTMIAWLLAGVGTVIGTLSTAVAKLYHSQIKGYVEREVSMTTKITTLEEKVSHCEEEHTAAKVYHSQIKGYVEREVSMTTKITTLEEKVSHCEEEHTAAKVELAKLEVRLSLVENKVNA